jgi:hypothetical protein
VTVGFLTMSSNRERKFDLETCLLAGSEGFAGGTSEKTVASGAAFSDVARGGEDDALDASDAESFSLFERELAFDEFGRDAAEGDFAFCGFVPGSFADVLRAISVGGFTFLESAVFVSGAFAESETEGGGVSLDDNVPDGGTAGIFCSGLATTLWPPRSFCSSVNRLSVGPGPSPTFIWEKSVICDLVEAHPPPKTGAPATTITVQATAHMAFTIPP